MTLISCPECKKEISDKSEHCIECGAPRHVILESIKSNDQNTEIAEDLDFFEESIECEWNEDTEIYIVYNTQSLTFEQAVSEVVKLEKEGYKDAGCLYIPNFVSFSGANKYIVFSSFHETSNDCAEEVNKQLMINPDVYGLLVSKFNTGIRINGVAKIKTIKFNNKNPLYKPIRITNITLFWILFFVEIITQEAMGVARPNGMPVFITFFLSRAWVRNVFIKKPEFRVKNLGYKIGATFLIWVAVFIIKQLIFGIILNVAI